MKKVCHCIACEITRGSAAYQPCMYLDTTSLPEIAKKDPLEKDVEKRFHRKIIKAGGISWKFVSPNNRGVCDRIVLWQGRTIFVEMKRTKGKMSDLQKVFRDKVLNNGGEFACVYGNAGTDEFIRMLAFDEIRFMGNVR